jgi:hypothetical protein
MITAMTVGCPVRRCRLTDLAEETAATRPTGVTTAAAAKGDVAVAAQSATAQISPPAMVGRSPASISGRRSWACRRRLWAGRSPRACFGRFAPA